MSENEIEQWNGINRMINRLVVMNSIILCVLGGFAYMDVGKER